MKQLGYVILFLYVLRMAFTSPTIQLEDDRYLDKEVNAVNPRELTTWITQLLLHKGEPAIIYKRNSELINSLLGIPRVVNQAGRNKGESNICTHKRNSELINSLLGLPKVLNEAGRK